MAFWPVIDGIISRPCLWVFTACGCLLLTSCSRSQSSDPSPTAIATSEPALAEGVSTPASKPTPNTIGQLGSIYYYETKSDPIGFIYEGKNKKGLNMVLIAYTPRYVLRYAACADPCRTIIIDQTGEEVPYDPSTLIGSVFQDIGNGFLKPAFRGQIPEIEIDRGGATRRSGADLGKDVREPAETAGSSDQPDAHPQIAYSLPH